MAAEPVLTLSPVPPAEIRRSGLGRHDFALCILLGLATVAIYFRATENPFVNFDDPSYVVDNPHIQHGLTKATFVWAFMNRYEMNWHPLTWLSHALDYQLFGLNPAGHHWTSVLLHIFNFGLLFLLLARATGSRAKSLIVAALFALHPINVESVAWVAERKNVLSMFFLLLTVAAYGWYARRPRPERYLLTTVLFALALTAKPMVVTLPLLLLLIDFWPLGRVQGVTSSTAALSVRQLSFLWLVVEKLPLLALSAASSLLTVWAQKPVISNNEGLPLAARIANAIYAYVAYIAKAIWPAHLAAFYPYEGLHISGLKVVLYATFLLTLSVWVWRKRSHPYLPVGWLWYLGSLVPVIGLVQVGDQAMADRYAYLPLIGIFCIIVWGIAEVVDRWGLDSRSTIVTTAAVLAVLSFLTRKQIGVWHSSFGLWSHAVAVTKDNYVAEDFVGTAIMLDDFKSTGQRFSDRAFAHFQNAVRIKPSDSISHLAIGAYRHEHGQVREAIEEYQLTLQLTSDPYMVQKALLDLGTAYRQLGDYSAAKQYYLQVIKADPENGVALDNLGKLVMDENIDQQARTAAAKPSATAYFQLGQSQRVAQRFAEARASFSQALKLDPQFKEAQEALSALNQASTP
jgi:Tfp pilus assembly protein PilF